MKISKSFSQSGLLWLWVSALVLALDRNMKLWALHHLVLFTPLKIVNVFNLTLAYNRGAAFSFLHSASGWQNWLLGGLAFGISVLILVWLATLSKTQRLINTALALILGGALGNVWDRIQYGYVIDFFDFHIKNWHFAIFNIADSAICLGTICLLIYWFKSK